MKKGFKFLFLFLGVLTLGLVLVACGKHEHTFASEWTFNASEHWHKATCEHTDEVSDKASHTFGGWQVRTAPTETSEGVEYRKCSVCGYEETRSVEKTPHTHTFADTWSSNETKHWHASTCGHADVISAEADHTWGDWTVVSEAGYLTKGFKKHTCAVCGKEVTEEIPARTYMLSSEIKENIIDALNIAEGKITFTNIVGESEIISTATFKNNVLELNDGETLSYYFIKEDHLYRLDLETGTEDIYLQKDITAEDSLLANELVNGIGVSNVIKLVSNSFGEANDVVTMFPADKVTFTWNTETLVYDITRTGGPATVAAADELVRAHEISELQKVVYLFNTLKITDNEIIFTASYPDENYSFAITFEENNNDVALPEKIYSATWSKEESGHYHAPLFDDGEAKHALGAHTYGEMIVDTEPYVDDQGEEQDGVGHKICTVCGYVLENQVIAHPAHEHNWGEWTVVTKPTFTELGSYERVCSKNSKHVEKVSLPVLTDSNYTITRKIEDNKVVEAISITVKDEAGNDLAVTYTVNYEIKLPSEADSLCAISGVYFKTPDQAGNVNHYIADNSTPTELPPELFNLPNPEQFGTFDEMVLLVEKVEKGLNVIAVVQVTHAEQPVTITGDVTATVNGAAYTSELKLVNGSSNKFVFTPAQGKAITKVVFVDLITNNDFEVKPNEDGSYTFVISGPLNITVETAYLYSELTSDALASLDFDNNEYQVIILGDNGTEGKYYMFDGSLDSTKITLNPNVVLEKESTPKVFTLVDGKFYADDALLASTFVLDKPFASKYTLKSQSGLYVGAYNTSSGSLYQSSTSGYFYEISFDESGNISMAYDTNKLQLNITKANVFKCYTSNQKQITVLYRVSKTYTAEEKAALVTERNTMLVETAKLSAKSNYVVLEQTQNITFTPNVVTVAITDADGTGATISNNVLAIPVQSHTSAKTITLSLTCGDVNDELIINLPEIEEISAKAAYDEIGTYNVDNKYSDNVYFITGVVKTVNDSGNKTKLTIYSVGNETDLLTVYDAYYTDDISKVYVGDTITVVGYLQKFVKDNETTREVTKNNGINVKFVSNRRIAGKTKIYFVNVPNDVTVNLGLDSENKIEVDNGTNCEFTLTYTGDKVIAVEKKHRGTDEIYSSLIADGNGKYTLLAESENFDVRIVLSVVKHFNEGYVKVTSISEFDPNAEYILVNETAGRANTATFNSSKKIESTEALAFGGKIVNNLSNFSRVSFEANDDGYNLILNEKYINHESTKTNVSSSTTAEKWSLAFENGNVLIGTTSGDNRLLEYNGNVIGSYAPGDSYYAQLYKYVSGDDVIETSEAELRTAANSILASILGAIPQNVTTNLDILIPSYATVEIITSDSLNITPVTLTTSKLSITLQSSAISTKLALKVIYNEVQSDLEVNYVEFNVAKAQTFTQITSIDDLNGAQVIIYDNGSALKNTISSNRATNESLTINDGVAITNNTAIIWLFTKVEDSVNHDNDYWTIYNAAENKYLSATTSKNQMQLVADTSDNHSHWTITVSDGKFTIVNIGRASDSDTPNNKFIRHNGNSGWACYGSGTGQLPILLKKD